MFLSARSFASLQEFVIVDMFHARARVYNYRLRAQEKSFLKHRARVLLSTRPGFGEGQGLSKRDDHVWRIGAGGETSDGEGDV